MEENKALLDRLCMSDSRQQSQMKTGLSIFLVVSLSVEELKCATNGGIDDSEQLCMSVFVIECGDFTMQQCREQTKRNWRYDKLFLSS